MSEKLIGIGVESFRVNLLDGETSCNCITIKPGELVWLDGVDALLSRMDFSEIKSWLKAKGYVLLSVDDLPTREDGA